MNNSNKITKFSLHPLYVVIPLCLWGLYLRLQMRKADLWLDEMMQLVTINRPFPEFVKMLPQFEHTSYLNGDFFLMYPFVKIFGFDKWCLAIPHLLATILGFYLLYLICQRYFQTIWAYGITFGLVCFNATLIKHALEIRPYAVLPTLALAVYYFMQMFIEQHRTFPRKKRLLLGVLLILTIWFHHYGIFMVFFTAFYFLWLRKKKDSWKNIIKTFFPFFAVIFLISMPLWCYSTWGPHRPSSWLHIQDTFQFIPGPVANPAGFFKGVVCNLVGYKLFYLLAAGLLVPAFLAYKNRSQQILFLCVLVILPIVFILLADIIQKYWFVQRQFIWVMPFFAFLLGWCWESGLIFLKRKNEEYTG